jgi:hypothetical protein
MHVVHDTSYDTPIVSSLMVTVHVNKYIYTKKKHTVLYSPVTIGDALEHEATCSATGPISSALRAWT